MPILTRLEQAQALDGVSDRLQSAVTNAVRPQVLRDLLHGTLTGHALHPVLVQAPVGAFISAAVLDLLPGNRRASTVLIAFGTAAVAPAALAGWLDWSQLTKDRRRVGLVHAAANVVATGFYAASLVARLRGRHSRGRALGYAGLSVAGAGAYLGGHLAYAMASGTNQAAPDLARLPDEWTSMGSLDSFPDGRPVVRDVGDVPVLFYRTGQDINAMLERCGHLTAPLGEGKVEGSGRDACVICPWHGSTFRLVDGKALHGPASSDQPTLRVRVEAGSVEVRQP